MRSCRSGNGLVCRFGSGGCDPSLPTEAQPVSLWGENIPSPFAFSLLLPRPLVSRWWVASSTTLVPAQAAPAAEILLLGSEATTDRRAPPESDLGAARGLEEAGDRGTAQPASAHENCFLGSKSLPAPPGRAQTSPAQPPPLSKSSRQSFISTPQKPFPSTSPRTNPSQNLRSSYKAIDKNLRTRLTLRHPSANSPIAQH